MLCCNVCRCVVPTTTQWTEGVFFVWIDHLKKSKDYRLKTLQRKSYIWFLMLIVHVQMADFRINQNTTICELLECHLKSFCEYCHFCVSLQYNKVFVRVTITLIFFTWKLQHSWKGSIAHLIRYINPYNILNSKKAAAIGA